MASFFFRLGQGPLPRWRGTWVLIDTWQWLVSASMWGLRKPRPTLLLFHQPAPIWSSQTWERIHCRSSVYVDQKSYSEDFDAASWNLRRNGQQFLPVHHKASWCGSWRGREPRRYVIHGSIWTFLQRVLPEQNIESSSILQSCLTRFYWTSLYFSLDLLQQNQGVAEVVSWE